jgi:hypothetical protein
MDVRVVSTRTYSFRRQLVHCCDRSCENETDWSCESQRDHRTAPPWLAHLHRPRESQSNQRSASPTTLATCPRPSPFPFPIETHANFAPHPPTQPPLFSSPPAVASTAVIARSPTPPSYWSGRQHGRRQPARSRPWRIPTTTSSCCRRRTSILHVDLTHRPRYPPHPLSSPHLPHIHDLILLLLLQNRSVSMWGGGSPRPVLLDGRACRSRPPGGGRPREWRRPEMQQLGVFWTHAWRTEATWRRRMPGCQPTTNRYSPTFACCAIVLPRLIDWLIRLQISLPDPI